MSMLPDVLFVQPYLFIEKHAGDHTEVRGMVGDQEAVGTDALTREQVVLLKQLL